MSRMDMDELVAKLVSDPKARQEWMDVARRLEEKHGDLKVAVEEKKKPLKVVKRFQEEGCCRLNYEDGYSLCFTSDGGMFLEKSHSENTVAVRSGTNLNTIRDDAPQVFAKFMAGHLLDLEDLMFVVTSTGFMFSREAVKAFERHKDVVASGEAKTRYVALDKKRAFVAGFVCGRKT